MDALQSFSCTATANDYHFYQNDTLPGLSGLQVDGQTSLFIAHNNSLLNTGLANITELKRLAILGNALTTLDFDALTQIGGRLEIVGLDDLSSMNNIFPELTQVQSEMLIWGNKNLQTMDGAFPKLSTTGAFSIGHNDRLSNVSRGFTTLITVGSFAVTNNIILPQCDVDILLARVNNIGAIEEGGNSNVNNCR